MKKRTAAGSIAATTTALLLLAAPVAASAHVHVTPDRAAPGSEIDLTFHVPDESATAGTVKLVVDLPTTTPFTSVSYLPIPGWTATVDTEKLQKPVTTDDGQTIDEAPIRVTWTAQPGTQIAPGQFQEFTISAGAVPDTGHIALPAHQTYSDWTVLDWTEKTPASGKEPEHPVPTLYVNDPVPADPDAGTVSTTATPTSGSGSATGGSATGTSASAGSDPLGIGLGLGGLALGAVALVVAVFAATRRREKVNG